MDRYSLSQTSPVRRAFTLIELLVVVAIISILASIAVPNFMDAQVRAKVARIKADMSSMSVGIATYFIDTNHFPVRRNTQARKNPNYDPAETNPLSPRFGEYLNAPKEPEISNNTNPHVKTAQFARLTTPIAYLSSFMVDVFDTRDHYPDNLLDYWDDYQTMWFIDGCPLLSNPDPVTSKYRINKPAEAGYLLVSFGPDGYLGVCTPAEARNYGWVYNSSKEIQGSMYICYDPSNGAVSTGNIYNGYQLGGMDGTPSNLTNRFQAPDLLQ